MNILGMGPLEVLLIVVLALIVFGPAKLPEIMAQVGKAIADFRRASSQLSDEFNRTIQAEVNQTRAVVDDARSALQGVPPAPQHVAAPPTASNDNEPSPAVIAGAAAAAALSGAATANGTEVSQAVPTDHPAGPSTPEASPPPPLADTSQWPWETTPESNKPEERAVRDDLQPPY